MHQNSWPAPQCGRLGACRLSAVRCVQQLLARLASEGSAEETETGSQRASHQRDMVAAQRSMLRLPPLRVLVAALCCVAVAMPCALVNAAGARANVTIVTTAAGLKAAFEGGAVHVHITEHLDLRGLPRLDELSPFYALFHPNSTLKSVTVRADPRPAVHERLHSVHCL